MDFRKDINGLRAFAVIAVVLFHFNSSWMPGGFAGVDVFFVISGFLMTGIIFRGIEQANFSIMKFYVARANRIIPALAVLCLVLLIFGWFYLAPGEYKALGQHVVGSMGFLSNIFYWRESGYFDAGSHAKWLLHTWSLSVEWQFYIIYPLVLVVLRKFISINALKLTILIGAILGFIFCVIATYKWPNPAYFLLPTRAWEMMIGGCAYLYPFNLKEQKSKLIGWLGVALIVVSYIFISEDNPWPGYLALMPVLGAFLVIQARQSDSVITGNVVFQKLGAWSYSIYLWHWPLVVAIYTYSLSNAYIYIGILLSILLGFLSHKYIEKIKFKNIFLNGKDYIKCKPIYMVAVVGGIGGAIFITSGFNDDLRHGASTPQAKFLSKHEVMLKNLHDTYWLKCDTYTSLNEHGTLITDPDCVNKKGDGGVFLWGDSHSEALSFGIRTLLEHLHVPFYQKTSAGCKASLSGTFSLKGKFKKACEHSNELALKSISKLKPKIVIISQADHHEDTDWVGIQKELLSLGVGKIILVGPVPQWKPSLPKVMIKPSNWDSNSILINDLGLELSIMKTDRVMSEMEFNQGFKYISLINELCITRSEKYYCRVKTDNGELLQVDYGHLSKAGSLFIVEHILSKEISSALDTSGLK